MRISFAAASGCGKSTLAYWLRDAYGFEMNPVGARSVAREMGLLDAKGEPNPYLADERGVRREFQRRTLEAKIAWEATRERFVTDRTTLDNLAYTIMHDVRALTAKDLRDQLAGLARYSVVFYCPTSAFQKLGDDGARIGGGAKTDEERADAHAYHDCYDALLFALLLRHRHDMIVLAHPDLAARKAIVRAALHLPEK